MVKLDNSKRTEEAYALNIFLRNISNTTLLTAEEEKDLAKRIAEGDKSARDRMITANLRLVVHIARGYIGKGLELNELIQEGNTGLIRAAEGYDPEFGTRFSTYASYWIKQSIGRAIINTGKLVRLPTHIVTLLGKWESAGEDLTIKLGHPPTDNEVAEVLNLSEEKMRRLEDARRIINAKIVPIDDDDAGEGHSELGDKNKDSVVSRNTEEISEWIAHVIDTVLSKRDAKIIRALYGLDGAPTKSLREVGRELGLTGERVRQIRKEILKKLAWALKELR